LEDNISRGDSTRPEEASGKIIEAAEVEPIEEEAAEEETSQSRAADRLLASSKEARFPRSHLRASKCSCRTST